MALLRGHPWLGACSPGHGGGDEGGQGEPVQVEAQSWDSRGWPTWLRPPLALCHTTQPPPEHLLGLGKTGLRCFQSQKHPSLPVTPPLGDAQGPLWAGPCGDTGQPFGGMGRD